MCRDIKTFDILFLYTYIFFCYYILIGERGEENKMKKTQAEKTFMVKEYLEKYPDIFTAEEKKYIVSCLKYEFEDYLIPDCLRELYDELGILSDDKNVYKGFIEIADEAFKLSHRNILEVGGGILPRLGERISALQETGSITVYDERLSKYKEDTDNLKLVRKNFDKTIEIGNADLLIGLMPCKAAELIIDVAALNNVDFMIALCEGGPHGDEFDYFEDEEEWQHSVIYSARCAVRDKDMGKLMIKSMENYGSSYPVIYNDRNRRKY